MEPSTRQELASFFLSFLFYIEKKKKKKKKGRPHPLPERCSTRNLLPVCGIPPRTLSALNPSILNRRQSERERYYAISQLSLGTPTHHGPATCRALATNPLHRRA